MGLSLHDQDDELSAISEQPDRLCVGVIMKELGPMAA